MIYNEGRVLLGRTNWGRRLDQNNAKKLKRGGGRARVDLPFCACTDVSSMLYWCLTEDTHSYCSGHMLMRVTGLQEGETNTKRRGKGGGGGGGVGQGEGRNRFFRVRGHTRSRQQRCGRSVLAEILLQYCRGQRRILRDFCHSGFIAWFLMCYSFCHHLLTVMSFQTWMT